MDGTLSDEDYTMVQTSEAGTAPSSVRNLEQSEITRNGFACASLGTEAAEAQRHVDGADEHDDRSTADDRTSICSSDLANKALGSITPTAHCTLTSIQKDDSQAVSQTAPRMPGREREIHMKLLLLGESGLGKTTFTRQLTRSYSTGGADITPEHDGSSSSMEQFRSDPGSLCTSLKPVVIADKNLRLHLKIQDMPGWGDDINIHRYLRTVMTYIMQQRAADYEELNGHRAFAKQYVSGCLTRSVTACLYFLPPHRIKQVDLILMSALSQQVILIPVIAKADTMTQEETEKYRQEILDRCLNTNCYVNRTQNGLPKLKVDFFSFHIDDLEVLEVKHTVPPFTIITSEQLDANSRPVRQYLWGVCDAANRNHSDFILLKRLLMGDKVNSLWCLLDDSYDRYVSFADAYEAAGLQLLPLVTAACAACGPHLEYDDYIKSQTQVKQLQADKEQLVRKLSAAHKAAYVSRQAATTFALAFLVVLVGLGAFMLPLRHFPGAAAVSNSSELLANVAGWDWAAAHAERARQAPGGDNMTSSIVEDTWDPYQAAMDAILRRHARGGDNSVVVADSSTQHAKPGAQGVRDDESEPAVGHYAAEWHNVAAVLAGLPHRYCPNLYSLFGAQAWLPSIARIPITSCIRWPGILAGACAPVLRGWQRLCGGVRTCACFARVVLQSAVQLLARLAPLDWIVLLVGVTLLASLLAQIQRWSKGGTTQPGRRTCLAAPRVNSDTEIATGQDDPGFETIWRINTLGHGPAYSTL